MVKHSQPIQSEDIDLTVAQELRTLNCVESILVDAQLKLGRPTRFTELSELIDKAIIEARTQIIGASDYINERD
jgi:hypothetical protein